MQRAFSGRAFRPEAKQVMQLAQFQGLITNMPVPYQAFTSKRKTWGKPHKCRAAADRALQAIFAGQEEVSVSRQDLTVLAQERDLAPFVMATVAWGFSGGMRGKHFSNLARQVPVLTSLLQRARDEGIKQWDDHFKRVRGIKGVGLSTYTKLLHFLKVRVQGYSALILDNRIIRIASKAIFDELAPLEGMSPYNAANRYPRYLACMHGLAESFGVSAASLEFFLFEFGLNLKRPAPQPRLLDEVARVKYR
jgi:hypothetical protein